MVSGTAGRALLSSNSQYDILYFSQTDRKKLGHRPESEIIRRHIELTKLYSDRTAASLSAIVNPALFSRKCLLVDGTSDDERIIETGLSNASLGIAPLYA